MKTVENKRVLIVLAGVLVALTIGFTQLFYFEAESAYQKPDTEQQSNTGEEEIISLPTSYSLPSAFHINLEHDFSFIEEILFDGDEPESTPVVLQLTIDQLFKTLFQVIISPNAP